MNEPAAAGAAPPGKSKSIAKILQLVAGFAVTIACFVYIFRSADVAALRAAVSQFDWRLGVLALASLAAGYFLRIFRWALMLRNGAPGIGWRDCAAPYLASIALNNLLPFRSGDVIRAFVFPAAMGVTRAHSLASLVFERLLDLIVLLALLGFGVTAIAGGAAPRWLTGSITTLSLIAAAAFLLSIFGHGLSRAVIAWLKHIKFLGASPLMQHLVGFAENVFAYVDGLVRGSRLAGVVALTVAIWCFEAGVFAAIMAGLGDPVTLAGMALIAGLATIATLAPSSPGYFGPFHLAAFESYHLLYGETGRAAAMAVMSHAAIWAPTTIAGVGVLIFTWRRFGRAALLQFQNPSKGAL